MKENFRKSAESDTLIDILTADNFSRLSDSNQQALINTLTNTDNKEGGFMGKLFGTRKENAAMHIVLTLCIILVIVGCVCSAIGKDYWNMIIPAITTGMGYMFGKGDL